ncbi:MAG: hypothetical protein HC857_00085 [Synechococcales cyanobacterium RU_4_20]|nr:hypothetical protein [Synechococcales cyanobacterium RU_4_20]
MSAMGGALIGVHGGISTFGESNEFGALLGAKADTRNNRTNLHSPNNTNVEISVNNHPANLGLPGSFAFADELYNFTTQPQAEFLFTVDESTYIGDNGVGGSNHPLAWVRNEGQGRVFYSALGHDEHLYEGSAPMDLLFQQHLEQGIEWALNRQAAPPIPSIVRINAGGGAYTDRNGNLWSADRYFTGGNVASTQAAIANTQDDPLYQSERWLRNLAYAVPVAANGDYQVTLKLADFWANAAGDRIFDLSAEGRKVLDDVDVFAQAGGKNIALDKTFNITVSDGILNLDFLASANNAKLSALEIIPKALTNPPPTFSRLINFQATASATPQGYSADIGEAFNPARGYGWITETSVGRTPVPVDLRGVARDRQDPNTDPRLNTFLHMEHIGNDAPAAAWEYTLPNGDYSVTVSVGDRYFDSTHRINVEGQNILPNFVPTSRQPYELATATVRVNDGRLTLDSIGGDNTRINYVEIKRVDPGNHPRIPSGVPLSRASNINRNAAITLDVDLLGTGSVVDGATLTNRTVQLYRTRDGAPVAGIANTTGGGDAIVFQPSRSLDANTHYTFRLSDGVKDESGVAFLPFSTTFSTGSNDNSNSAIRFNKSTVYTGIGPLGFSSLETSPDGTQLYGATITGELHRWTIAADGRLTNQQTFLGLANANRSIIGLVFDPQDPKTLWITNNDSVVTPPPANDFTSKISKVTLNSGSSFAPTVTDYVVGLPRATRSHMSNSLEFGPDGALYLTQGGNAATGAPDSNWGNRPERLLTASVLRIDPRRTAPVGGFNVQTETYNGKPGTYNPLCAQCPRSRYTARESAMPTTWSGIAMALFMCRITVAVRQKAIRQMTLGRHSTKSFWASIPKMIICIESNPGATTVTPTRPKVITSSTGGILRQGSIQRRSINMPWVPSRIRCIGVLLTILAATVRPMARSNTWAMPLGANCAINSW